VLILGGGDGFAAREVFKWVNIGSVTVVDWDKQFVFDFGMGLLSSYNKNVYTRHNCLYEHDDALNYLVKTPHKYDVIIIDFPDPDSPHMIELYSTVIRYTKKVLAPHGAIRMHVGPASLNPSHPNWKTIGMLKDILLHTFSGYVDFGSVYVPSFSNEWAFLQMNRQVKNLFGDPKYVENQCKLWRTDREPKSVDIQTIYATV
jgi:spermidine synthase